MRWIVRPGATLRGEIRVPGDKSIAHRWLILAATAEGRSSIGALPRSLDVRSSAACLAAVAPAARPSLEVWSAKAAAGVEGGGSTWNGDEADEGSAPLEVEGEGRSALRPAPGGLDCGNSGTTMRLLSGIVASAPFPTVLRGDASLSSRPMERVAGPLRAMGATVRTTDGHPPVIIEGAALHGIRHVLDVASAQVKGAILLAGVAAEGTTTVVEPVPLRDHTERALEALGAPVERLDGGVRVGPFRHEGFTGSVPGDPSSAAFLVAAAGLTGSSIVIRDVGVNPTRLHFLDVMRRMGIETDVAVERHEVGEPVGSIAVRPASEVRPVRIERDEIPLVIDEVPILAIVAAHADGESWFAGAGELRVKESDRLAAVARGIRAVGGHAAEEGDDLVLAGGGLDGGTVPSGADHRIAMAFAVTALAAEGPVVVGEAEAADVSFPGFADVLRALGAEIEVTG